MTLEKVKKHKYREDLFSREVISMGNEVNFNDILMIKEILLEEVS
jgi:hypothetical protein